MRQPFPIIEMAGAFFFCYVYLFQQDKGPKPLTYHILSRNAFRGASKDQKELTQR